MIFRVECPILPILVRYCPFVKFILLQEEEHTRVTLPLNQLKNRVFMMKYGNSCYKLEITKGNSQNCKRRLHNGKNMEKYAFKQKRSNLYIFFSMTKAFIEWPVLFVDVFPISERVLFSLNHFPIFYTKSSIS